MEIWHLARNFAPMSLVDDRPTLRSTSAFWGAKAAPTRSS